MIIICFLQPSSTVWQLALSEQANPFKQVRPAGKLTAPLPAD